MKRITIFLHIPKTGGGAFDDRARTIFDNPSPNQPRLSWAEAQEKPLEYWVEFGYISGHYPLSFTEQFRDADIDILTVMLFRDPVARVLSHWSYIHKEGYWRNPEYTAWLREATLEEWLTNLNTIAHSNLQACFLHDRIDYSGDETVKSLATIDILGIQNRVDGLQDAMDMMCKVLNKPSPQITNIANVSYGVPLYNLKPETLAQIQTQNQVDSALYEIVKDIIDKRVSLEVFE